MGIKRQKVVAVLFTLLSFVLFWTFTGCGSESDSENGTTIDPQEKTPATFTINFETFDGVTEEGETIPSQTVLYGDKVTRPETVYLNQCAVAGWYLDIDYQNEFDFNSPLTGATADISSDTITLYAKYMAPGNYHVVKFVTNGGTELETRFVRNRDHVYLDSNPTKEHFVFEGWYTDSEFKNYFKISTPVTKNLILYAKWEAKPSIVSVISSDISVTKTVGSDGAIHFESEDIGYWHLDDKDVAFGKSYDFNPAEYLKGTYVIWFTVTKNDRNYSYTASIKVE